MLTKAYLTLSNVKMGIDLVKYLIPLVHRLKVHVKIQEGRWYTKIK